MMDYDESTAFMGQWGRFQQVVFFLLCASIVPNGVGVFSVVFLTDIPRHHCLIPEENLTQDWRDAIIPKEVVNGKQQQSRCSRYRLDVVRNLSAQGFIPGRDVNLTELEQEGCVDRWSYSKDIYQSTVVSEFDLVCSDQWKQPFTSTACFLGILVGSFISGQLSDRFGRKLVFFATMAVQTIFSFCQAFSPSWKVFTILIFFNGLGQISNYVSGFVLGTEILTGDVRVIFSSMGVCLGFAIGYMILPLIAFFLRDWTSLSLAISLPGVLYIPLWWLIPESPRWLLSQGRVEEAEAIVRKAAKTNRVEAPTVIFKDYRTHDDDMHPQEHLNVISLVKTQSVRSTTVILCLVWFSLSIGYFGLSLNTSRLHANPYISCFISAAVEVPAYMSCWLTLKYFPRRLSVIFILLLGGVSLYLIQLVPENLQYVALALEMTGKCGFTTAFSIVYIYTAEVYPTVLRNVGMGMCSSAARIGSITAPYVTYLGSYNKALPYYILMGSLTIASSVVNLFLLETLNRDLPETVEQMQECQGLCNGLKKRKYLEDEGRKNLPIQREVRQDLQAGPWSISKKYEKHMSLLIY
ncbi:LOW QUALITY PROTEIN: organic cation/carnitine transporter 2-like [Pseudochaenichthys georgianus]|uniref:LOW QUALITY PROTEIN: organic cation/carnitine transporter 2-like n=1 Tax=Pseudochaenichthys georgianus TaxID=52239 RepID=UPI0039C11FCC